MFLTSLSCSLRGSGTPERSGAARPRWEARGSGRYGRTAPGRAAPKECERHPGTAGSLSGLYRRVMTFAVMRAAASEAR
jgi:hypothetical protein